MSSWCFWSEPSWAELKQRFQGRVEFEWKIALMDSEAFPKTREQCDWFYRRSGFVVRSPFMLNSGWLEPHRKGDYRAANWVAEAGRDFGFNGDELRLSLTLAALRDGRRIGDIHESVAVACERFGLDAEELLLSAQSVAVRNRVEISTREFIEHHVTQRPTVILRSRIGDKAVFSGLHRVEPLAATIEAMLADETAYDSHEAHFGCAPES